MPAHATFTATHEKPHSNCWHMRFTLNLQPSPCWASAVVSAGPEHSQATAVRTSGTAARSRPATIIKPVNARHDRAMSQELCRGVGCVCCKLLLSQGSLCRSAMLWVCLGLCLRCFMYKVLLFCGWSCAATLLAWHVHNTPATGGSFRLHGCRAFRHSSSCIGCAVWRIVWLTPLPTCRCITCIP